ncbi:hypothetical protein ACROYT_G006406 [Oculina patagonica]
MIVTGTAFSDYISEIPIAYSYITSFVRLLDCEFLIWIEIDPRFTRLSVCEVSGKFQSKVKASQVEKGVRRRQQCSSNSII